VPGIADLGSQGFDPPIEVRILHIQSVLAREDIRAFENALVYGIFQHGSFGRGEKSLGPAGTIFWLFCP